MRYCAFLVFAIATFAFIFRYIASPLAPLPNGQSEPVVFGDIRDGQVTVFFILWIIAFRMSGLFYRKRFIPPTRLRLFYLTRYVLFLLGLLGCFILHLVAAGHSDLIEVKRFCLGKAVLVLMVAWFFIVYEWMRLKVG